MNTEKKVWFITGVSRGLGKVIAEQVLKRGDLVIGTTRDGKSNIEAAEGTFHVLPLDVTDKMQVVTAVRKAQQIFGRIDVLVNNAGYGLFGVVEEINQAAAKEMFETNFFGAVSVMQSMLSVMREQGSGHILNISSVGGLAGFAGWGLYSASKFALEGLSESLAMEVKPFGINVTIVEPGTFKTDFLSQQSLKVTPVSDDYPEMQEVAKNWSKMNGAQTGDPEKAAEVLFNITREEQPPLRLVLGSDALEIINKKVEDLTDELQRYASISRSTDNVGV